MAATDANDQLRLDGRVAIVSGAGRGLGRAHATLLAELGALVVVNDIDASATDDAASAIAGALPATADVATQAGAEGVVAATVAEHGRVDIVVANAGTSFHRPFAELTEDDLDRVLRPSLHGTFHLVLAAWEHLRHSGNGRVVTTASGAVFGFAGRAHYAAAKGAVLALTNTLAVEGADDGIRANCVLPWGATRLSRPGSAAPDVALAAPPVAWLCHPLCEENGSAFTIGRNRIARVGFGPRGSRAVEPTVESVREALALLPASASPEA